MHVLVFPLLPIIEAWTRLQYQIIIVPLIMYCTYNPRRTYSLFAELTIKNPHGKYKANKAYPHCTRSLPSKTQEI
jgi:hypothetical protein